MKTKTILTLSMMVLLALAGCVPVSLQPFYETKDLVFEPALVGVWGEKDAAEGALDYWSFSEGTNKSYVLEIADGGKVARFHAHTFTLGTNLFLDIFPDEQSLKKSRLNDTYAMHLVPAHSLALVVRHQPTLNLAFLRLDWLTKFLKQNPTALRHEVLDDERLVLTASTGNLQAFVLEHLDQAFDREAEGLKRLADKP